MRNGKLLSTLTFVFLVLTYYHLTCEFVRLDRAHPYFVSIESYKELIDDTGLMNEVTSKDWNEQPFALWRHSV